MAMFLLVGFVLSFLSCSREGDSLLEREDLFRINLGVMSDELDYIYRERALLPGTADLYMDDGIFYLSSYNMGKIMGFNSYGDLITLIYNNEINTAPREIVLGDDSANSNKQFVPWGFRNPGELGLSNGLLVVEDRVAQDQLFYDEELQAYCDTIFLRFDEEGQYLDFIGREGLGGRPFPYVEELQFREDGDMVVFCRLDRGWQIYWFSPQGDLLYRIFLEEEFYPQFEDGMEPYVTQLYADPVEYRVFVMISYYPVEQGDDRIPEKRIYQLDLMTNSYNDGHSVPDEVIRSGGQEKRFVYEMLGITQEGQILFISPVDYNRFMLVGMDDQGKILFKREIEAAREPVLFSDFYLSPQGILSALLFHERGASISWWRTDRLFRR